MWVQHTGNASMRILKPCTTNVKACQWLLSVGVILSSNTRYCSICCICDAINVPLFTFVWGICGNTEHACCSVPDVWPKVLDILLHRCRLDAKLKNLVSWNKDFMNNIAWAWQWLFSGWQFSLNIMLVSCTDVPEAEKAAIRGVSTLWTWKESQNHEVFTDIPIVVFVVDFLQQFLDILIVFLDMTEWATGMEENWWLLCSRTAFILLIELPMNKYPLSRSWGRPLASKSPSTSVL